MITFQLQLPVPPTPLPSGALGAPACARVAGKPLEPTVRVDGQQFPSQIQDGGRGVRPRWVSCNKCDKNCCLHNECIYSFFFNAKLSRNISSFMLFFGTQLQFSLRKCVQSDTVLPSLASCLKAKDKNICMFSDVVGRCTLSRVWVGKYSKSTDCNSLPCDFFQGSRSTWFSFCPVNEELVKVRFTTQIEWSLHSKG